MNPNRPKFRSPPQLTSPRFPNYDSLKISMTPSLKMPKRSILKPTLTLAVLISLLALYAFLNSFIFSTPLSINNAIGFADAGSNVEYFGVKHPVPVKVYMYDLPRNFTYGVIESYNLARGGERVEDDALLKYPGTQHAAEWHLFTSLLLPNHDRAGSSVIPVSDPEQADLFYVPFFSSLSLVVNPVNRPPSGDRPVYSDEKTQDTLIEYLGQQEYWKRNNGWDHVFICQDPNALYKVVDKVKNGVLLVSDFGRLSRDQASLVKDVILPYSHRINPYQGDIGIQNRKTLLFFMGNRYRKEGGKIRDLLFQVLESETDVIIKHGTQSRESRRAATQGMHASKFCLHPAGDTPSACRLFDAIVSLCIPVIVSDYIELPFEDVIDYRKIAIFVDSYTAIKKGALVKRLRGMSMEKILELQRELKKVQHYFVYDDPNGAVKEIWRQVSSKLPHIKLMINRDKRLLKRDLNEPDCSCLCSNHSGIHTTL
nr:probable arabinosyltransferase ARAD1 [Ipomoea batatas]